MLRGWISDRGRACKPALGHTVGTGGSFPTGKVASANVVRGKGYPVTCLCWRRADLEVKL